MTTKKSTIEIVFTLFLGVFFMVAGIGHFVNPEKYFAFIPDFLPKPPANNLAGFVEIIAGAFLFVSKLRKIAGLIILVMMVVFLPLHVIDIFKDKPAIGSHTLAIIRLPLQFVMIYWAWYIFKSN